MSETRERVESRDDVLRVLRAHEAELRAMGIERLHLFGSFARDEARAASDVDLLATVEGEGLDAFDVSCGAERMLERVVGRSVDVLTEIRAGLFRRNVNEDLRVVF